MLGLGIVITFDFFSFIYFACFRICCCHLNKQQQRNRDGKKEANKTINWCANGNSITRQIEIRQCFDNDAKF